MAKSGQEQGVILDKETGKNIAEHNDIKKVSLKYGINLLTNRVPKPEFAKVIEEKESLPQMRMTEHVEEDIEDIDFDAYESVLVKIKKKSKNKYDFITKAGKAFHYALFNLFRTIWSSEMVPEGWRESILVQLRKSGGKPGDLDFMRHIHI